jgi:hypothetical protein
MKDQTLTLKVLHFICYLLALLAHDFLHVSRIRVKSLTLRLLMAYIYIYEAPILDVSRSQTATQHSRLTSRNIPDDLNLQLTNTLLTPQYTVACIKTNSIPVRKL